MVRARGNTAAHMALKHFLMRGLETSIKADKMSCTTFTVTCLCQRWAVSRWEALLSLIISIKLCTSKALKATPFAPIW